MWPFHKMQLANVESNTFTFGNLLSGCATTTILQKGKQFHNLAIENKDLKTIWWWELQSYICIQNMVKWNMHS